MELTPSKAQNKYLVVIQYSFTRWVELKPIRKADCKSLQAIEKLIVFCWETPNSCLCDSGKELGNKVVKKMLEDHGINHAPIFSYHAQADPVERF